MKDIVDITEAYLRSKDKNYTLATLVNREGSSYRLPGARMLIHPQGHYVGCISGGCLEREVVAAAQEVLRSGHSRLLTFDTRPFFGCGGKIQLYLESLAANLHSTELFQQVDAALRERHPFYLLTPKVMEPEVTLFTEFHTIEPKDKPDYFCDAVKSRPRLIVIGGGSDVHPLLNLARTLSWDTRHVVHPESEVALADATDSIQIVAPNTLAQQFVPDARTAVVIMNHNYARDAHYLQFALEHKYGYIGLLGARKRREELLNTIMESGAQFDSEALDTLHAPTGLDLGADSPEGIALSIIAEIQAHLSQRSGTALRIRESAIYE